MTRPARPDARPGRRALTAALTTGVLAACAALTVAAAPARHPARPAAAPTAVTTPVLLTAHSSSAPPVTASPPPSPGPAPAASPGASSGPGCGFLDVSCEIGNAITSWFAALARDALRPLLTLVGETVLSSPQAGAIPAVHSMWITSLAIADSAYVLLVVIGGVIVMGHETLQTSYSVKDIAPRLVTAFLTANLSLILISQATSAANALSAALAGRGVTPSTAAAALLGALTAPLSGGGIFLVLLALAGAVLALVLVVVYVLRLMALVLLTAAAPLALAAHALPQTAWVARWWWRALAAALAIPAAQALVLTAAVRVFSSAGWLPLHGGTPGLLPVLTALCLLYIMMRIPWWISRPVLGAFGPSPIRRAARFAFYAAVLSRVSPLLHGAAGGRRPPAAAGGRGRGPAGPRGGGPFGGRPGGGPGGAGPRRQPGGGQPGNMPTAGGARPGRQPPGPARPARGSRHAPASGGTGRGTVPPRSSPGGTAPAGNRTAGGAPAAAQRPRQVQPPLPGMPPRPRPPRQAALPFEVTRVPRTAAPGNAAPGPWPPLAQPRRPARPRPAQPPLRRMAGRPRPPRQFPLPLDPPPARRPGQRAAVPSPARHRPPPVPRVPEGDHR
jgi:hypothetical protein